jgi:hypothetical protein
VHHDVRCDIDEVIFNETDHTLEAVTVDYDKQEWIVKHDSITVLTLLALLVQKYKH